MTASVTIVGHEPVLARFAQAMQRGRLHHAWLLHGPAGIGKATVARVLATQYLCTAGEGCGQCPSCHLLQAGTHPDFLHIEAEEGKRDVRIAQVRQALDFLALSGRESERRVVLLDEAERMNPQAANALLKGLEEPAPGSLLLIVCADAMRLPATIRSRCLSMPCAPLSDAQTWQVLAGLGVADAYRELAMLLAHGAPGRAVCLRDPEVAEALQAWRTLVADAAKADVGQVEQWLRTHLGSVPHEAVIELLVRAHLPRWQRITDYAGHHAIGEALQALARWPSDVLRHGLRPAPSLLVAFLRLRAALQGEH